MVFAELFLLWSHWPYGSKYPPDLREGSCFCNRSGQRKDSVYATTWLWRSIQAKSGLMDRLEFELEPHHSGLISMSGRKGGIKMSWTTREKVGKSGVWKKKSSMRAGHQNPSVCIFGCENCFVLNSLSLLLVSQSYTKFAPTLCFWACFTSDTLIIIHAYNYGLFLQQQLIKRIHCQCPKPFLYLVECPPPSLLCNQCKRETAQIGDSGLKSIT